MLLPYDHVYWYLPTISAPSLRANKKADIAIIGGGMAGLSAAQAFHERGCSVILLEKNFCGAGASGKSSGFITPDSEVSLHEFVNHYGQQQAHALWEFVVRGVEAIRTNIIKYSLSCDYQIQDCLVVTNNKKDFEELRSEHQARLNNNYDSLLLNQDNLLSHIKSSYYIGGLTYRNTFSINSFDYCQGMKQILQKNGIEIYEDTPVISCQNGHVITEHARVIADHIIICVDWQTIQLHKLLTQIYHVQTFLMISEVLQPEIISALFPHKHYMVWDTDLIYTYFRMTGDNRLLMGGGSLLSTYDLHVTHNFSYIVKKFERSWRNIFPDIKLRFEYIWPGLIGVSKDLLPIAGHDRDDNTLYYVTTATGLPWAATLGIYSAEKICDGRSDFDHYFSPYRSFFIQDIPQKILGTRLSFALSHAYLRLYL